MRDVARTISPRESFVSSAKRGRVGLYQKDRHLRKSKETTKTTDEEGFPCEAAIGCVIVVVRTTLLREARASSARNNKALQAL